MFSSTLYVYLLYSNGELDKLKRMARASSCIAMGDVINKAIRMDRWSLLPMQVRLIHPPRGFMYFILPPYSPHIVNWSYVSYCAC